MTEQPRSTSPASGAEESASPITTSDTGASGPRRWFGLLRARRTARPGKVDTPAGALGQRAGAVEGENSEGGPVAQPGPTGTAGPESKAGTDPSSKPEVGASKASSPSPADEVKDPGSKPEAGTAKAAAGAPPKAEAGAEPKTGPGADPKAGSGSGLKAGSGGDPKTGAGADPKAAAGAGAAVKAGPEAATGKDPKSEDGGDTATAPAAPAPHRTLGAPFRRKRKELSAARPPGAPPDPWTAFATTPDQPPGRLRRALRAVRRSLIHEFALAVYASSLLAVMMTWPTLRWPLHTLPQDLGDPSRQAWQLSWAGHILLNDPVRLWQSNAYFPVTDSFAFGSSLLGYAPFGMLGTGPAAAVLRYNILFVAAHALLALGAYALVRQLGARPTGAAVAAMAFAYAPWRLAQEGHLDVIAAGGIPLALAMLARGHGYSLRYGLRTGRQHAGWAAGGWLVASWQLTLGFSLGVPFAYVLGLILLALLIGGLVHRLRRTDYRLFFRFLRPPVVPLFGWRLRATDALGTLIFTGVGLLIAVPYTRVPDTSTRLQEIEFFSPPLRGLLIGPAESRVWGAAHATPRSSLGWAAEMSLLPGFALYALALAGIGFSIWRFRHRMLLAAGVAVTVVLTLGTTWFDGRWSYLPLFGHFPASFDLRISGRLMLWVTLLLAVLAAGAVDEFVRRAEHMASLRMPPWPGPWLRLAMLTPLILVALEGWNATAHPIVPEQPAAMRTAAGPMLVLPTAELTDQTIQLWSTSKFQEIANGGGTFAGARQSELRARVATFPDAASVDYLRSIGVGSVLLIRSQVAGTPWERSGNVPVDALGIRREDLSDAVLFRLNQPEPAQPPPAAGQPGPAQTPVPGQPNPTQPLVPGQINPTPALPPGQVTPTQPLPGQPNPAQTLVPGQVTPTQTLVPGQVTPTQTLLPGQVNPPLLAGRPNPAQTQGPG